jgi:lysophospholipase L1-like esterase
MHGKIRIISAITAGSLALTAVAIGASSGSSQTATHAALAAQTQSFPPVNLDDCPTLHTGYPLGECVAQLQTDLNLAAGNQILDVDGIFGPVGSQTYQAVIAFQRAHGLEQDGKVGPATKQALENAASAPESPPSTSSAPPAPTAPTAPTGYVALGDSFSSGEGNTEYDPGTDVPTDKCHRSAAAYPHLLAAQTGEWNLGPNDFAACSGSTIQNVVYGQTSQTHREGTQLGQLNSSTSKVTISIGGNDIDFSTVVRDCLYGVNIPAVHGSRDCADKIFTGGSSTNGMTLREYEDQLISGLGQDMPCTTPQGDLPAQCTGLVPSLAHLYELIQRDAPNASIYVLLYPHLFNDEPGPSQCDIYGFSVGYSRIGAHVFISQANQQFIDSGADQLDAEIISQVEQAQSAGAKVTYIDPRLLFDGGGQGHGVCSDHPWVNGLHLNLDGTPAPESFHPNADGQAAFAEAIQNDLR